MKQLKNKILIKVNRKLIFIISILIIAALNLFGEERIRIRFEYYDYTNKVYHSTLKTEIIPSEYVFMTTFSNKDHYYRNENLYLYNLKTKEKKLFYVNNYNNYNNNNWYYEYYDINGNLTTNWTDTNMEANGFYKITNNRFGETFYNRIYYDSSISFGITKTNDYIQKAYKYSLTQPEIINKKDRGIYLFRGHINNINRYRFSLLCLQNEYYNGYLMEEEENLLNYDAKGRVIFNFYVNLKFSYMYYNNYLKSWNTWSDSLSSEYTNTIYFNLNDKTLIKPTWNEVTNDFLNHRNSIQKKDKVYYYTKENIENNLREYDIADIKFLGYIPIEEFEYYLLAD